MKKSIITLTIMMTMILTSFSSVYADKKVDMLTDKISEGIVSVSIDNLSAKTKVLIQKGSDKYFYDLKKSGDAFPLQLGSGAYTVSVLKNISGNKYSVVATESFHAKIADNNAVYLSSAQPINWNKDMKAIKLAAELTAGKTDGQAVEAIYSYIIENIKYDYNKINTVEADYIPEIDKILEAKSGICYDYSALFAAMTRSIDVPTKLIKGYREGISVYHAWNEVYLDGKWIVVDTTYDASVKKTNEKVQIANAAEAYSKSKEF